METYLQSVEENNRQPKLMCPAKLSPKNEHEIKSFTDNERNTKKQQKERKTMKLRQAKSPVQSYKSLRW